MNHFFITGRATLLAIAALMGFACCASQLNAAPITSSGGVFLSSQVQSPGLLLKLGTIVLVSPPQPASDPFGQITANNYSVNSSTNFQIDLTPYTSNNVLGNVDLPTITIKGEAGSGADSGNTAVLTFVAGSGILNEGGAADSLRGVYQLSSSTLTGIDFGPVGTSFLLDLSLQGTTFTTGANGGSVTGAPTTTSFDLNAVPATAIAPEPTSLAVFGLVTLAAGAYGWRRRKLAAV